MEELIKIKKVIGYLLIGFLILFVVTPFLNGVLQILAFILSLILLTISIVIRLTKWVCPFCGGNLGRMDNTKRCKHCGKEVL